MFSTTICGKRHFDVISVGRTCAAVAAYCRFRSLHNVHNEAYEDFAAQSQNESRKKALDQILHADRQSTVTHILLLFFCLFWPSLVWLKLF